MTATEQAKKRIQNGQTVTKKQLAQCYGVSGKTLKSWLMRIPGYQKNRKQIIEPHWLAIVQAFYGPIK